MALDLAVLEQLGHRALHGVIALAIDVGADGRELLQERRRRDDEAEAQAGREDLRQGAEVDDHARGIGGGQREHGAAVVVELVIVVVLDHGDALGARELEEGEAPARGEHRRRRVLVVRRDVDGAHPLAIAELGEGVNVEAVRVHRQRDEARARGPQRGPRGAIPERLHRHDIPGRDQGARHEVERHLAPAGDQQRLLRRRQPPQRREHRPERLAQARVTARIAVVEGARAPVHDRPAVGARQGRRGDEAEIGHAARHHERARGVDGVRVGLDRRADVEPRRRRGHSARRAGLARRRGHRARHHRAPRRLGLDPPSAVSSP